MLQYVMQSLNCKHAIKSIQSNIFTNQSLTFQVVLSTVLIKKLTHPTIFKAKRNKSNTFLIKATNGKTYPYMPWNGRVNPCWPQHPLSKMDYISSHVSSFPQPKHRQLWPSPKCPESYCRVTISKVDFELANILAGSDSGDLS